MRNNDLEKIVAEIARKIDNRTTTHFISHSEYHPYNDVGIKSRKVEFYIKPVIKDTSNLPLASNALFLDFLLDFEVSRGTYEPNHELEKKYQDVKKLFIAKCDKLHPDDTIEISYSRRLRLQHIKDKCGENVNCYQSVPLIYHPLGFEMYTSPFTRKDESTPEVISVKVIDEP